MNAPMNRGRDFNELSSGVRATEHVSATARHSGQLHAHTVPYHATLRTCIQRCETGQVANGSRQASNVVGVDEQGLKLG